MTVHILHAINFRHLVRLAASHGCSDSYQCFVRTFFLSISPAKTKTNSGATWLYNTYLVIILLSQGLTPRARPTNAH